MWRLLRNRLSTKDNLVRRHVLHQDDAACVSGWGNLEAAAHLFLACDIFSSLWSHVWHWLGISSVSYGDLRQHFVHFTNMAGLPRSTHLFFRIIWFASIWVLWKERNDHVFQNTASNSSILIKRLNWHLSYDWNQNMWYLTTVIMIGRNICFFVWVSTCNPFSLLWWFGGAS